MYLMEDSASVIVPVDAFKAVPAKRMPSDILQSSMFVIDLNTGTEDLRIHHPAGFDIKIDFADAPFVLKPVAIVGSKLLVVYQDWFFKIHHGILDLEIFFSERVPDFPKLIRAPCRACSLPSVGSCCRTPYCGSECQKEDWIKHKQCCKGH
jgi:hypothetical protein